MKKGKLFGIVAIIAFITAIVGTLYVLKKRGLISFENCCDFDFDDCCCDECLEGDEKVAVEAEEIAED